MRLRRLAGNAFLLWLPLCLLAIPLTAHHSLAAEYAAQLVTVRGTVVKFQWRNPHVWISLETRDAKGAKMTLLCEGNGPGALTDHGWNRDTLKPGDKVALEGYRAKYRPDGFKVHTVILASGTRMFME